jgi:hypothetical protein
MKSLNHLCNGIDFELLLLVEKISENKEEYDYEDWGVATTYRRCI